MTDMDQLDENLKAMARAVRRHRPEDCWPLQLQQIGPIVLPHVRRVRRPVPAGAAGGRRPSLPHLRRWLRPVRPRPRAIPGTRRARTPAVKCGDCPGCTVQCPYGVQVTGRLIRAQELFAC